MKRSSQQRPQVLRAAMVDVLENRQLLSASASANGAMYALDVQSFDGVGNNIASPDLGSTNVTLDRYASANYADDIAEPNDAALPSAREISNIIAAQSESQTNDRYLTDFTWLWGQFLDHDIDLSLTTEEAGHAEEFPIEVPTGDVFFDPFNTGTQEIPLSRSEYDESSGVREQVNAITSFVDGSNVYGSDTARATELRTLTGGRLKTSDGDLLPFNTAGLPNAGGTSDSLFLAGDVRANENVGLSSLHTLFVREHNRLADEFAQEDPSLTDEQLYQKARRIVISELQAITYNEFLPALLGYGALDSYTGYNPNVNPNIANEFSTAAFRLGHSLLSPELLRIGADGNVIADGNLALRDAFFNPQEILDEGIESILRGASIGLSQELDAEVIDDVRNFLFGPPGAGGLDLPALNIQRGRDHGLASYNDTRVAVGLAPAESFADITSDPELQAKLEDAYGDVDSVELWIGLLSEDHVANASVGETMQLILVDQFSRLRDGDRFWYENVFRMDSKALNRLRSTSLKDIIEANTDIEGLQDNVFFDAGVVIHQLPDLDNANRANRINVSVTDTRVVIRDIRTTQPLQIHAREDVKQIMILGSDRQVDRVTLDVRRTSTPLEGGIVFIGGDNARDRISVLGTNGTDVVDVTTETVMFNEHNIYHGGVELIDLRTMSTGDVINIADDIDIAPGVRLHIMTRRHHRPVRTRGDHTRRAPMPRTVQPPMTHTPHMRQANGSSDRTDDLDDLFDRVARNLVEETGDSNLKTPIDILSTLR